MLACISSVLLPSENAGAVRDGDFCAGKRGGRLAGHGDPDAQ